MTTYPVDIPALAPLASGVDDNPAEGISQGDELQENHVVAATNQHSNRKRLFRCVPSLVTPEELVASKRRKYSVESANFDGETPLWAQMLQQQMQEMQQQMQEMQQQMQEMPTQQQMQQQMQEMPTRQEMQQQMQQMSTRQEMQELRQLMLQMVEQMQEVHALQMPTQQRMDTLHREIQRESQRSMNRSRRATTDPIEMLVRVEDGQMPDQQDPALWFPTNQEELLVVATEDQVSALLQFYNEAADGTLVQQKKRLMRFLGVTL